MKLPPEQEAIRAKCFHPSGTFVEFPMEDVETSISARFEKIVRMYPDRLAAKKQDDFLTYDTLNRAANRVARMIINRLGRGNNPIVIFSEQNLTAIVFSLAIWKSGKILIAIESSWPGEQTILTIKDMQPEAILTTDASIYLSDKVKARFTAPIMEVDPFAIDGLSENLNFQIASETSADVRYSSGSSGKPKGIVRSHRRLLSSARSTINFAHLCPDDRLIALTKLSFGGRDLLRSLLCGAAVFPFDIQKDGVLDLVRLLKSERITCYQSVPSIFRSVVRTFEETDRFPFIRLLQLGGELLYRSDVDAYRKHFPDECILTNRLSAGEAGNLCVFFVDKSTKIDSPIVPVGYPVEGKTILLLNHEGERTGVNEAGEIAVRSRNLSSGYWKDPDLTDARFRTDLITGERIYLTGDLGKILPDGSMVYLGRKDREVNIRGMKVDLAELEATLVETGEIAEAIVVLLMDEGGEQKLVAYVVPKRVKRPSIIELRGHVQRVLPNSVVPSRFVFLDALPLTPHGKVDRHALPSSGNERPELGSVFVAPQDEMQRGLARIWEKLLGVRPIGVIDSFFDLGGHSLAAVQLVAEIEKAFKKRLAPAALFQAPTIEQLAKIIRHGPESWSSLVPLQTNGAKLPFFWIHGDSSNAFLPRYLGTDQPLYGLEHQSQDGKPARYASVESIAANYLREIRSVQAQGPYYLGGYSFGSVVALEIAQQLKDQAQEVALLALLDPPRPFKISDRTSTRLSQGPTSINRFHSRLDRHYNKVKSLGNKGGLTYLWERVAGKINELRSSVSTKVSNGLKRALIKICLARGRDLPSSVRSRYILDLYHRIRPEYEMRPYSGRVVLFKGDDQTDNYVGDWEPYLLGEKQIYQVPGHHMELREEPYIRSWAEHLKACLEAAQVTDTPSVRESETARTRNPAAYSVAK